MMHVLKWASLRERCVFYPDEGGVAGAAPSGGSGGAGGDTGGGSSVASPGGTPAPADGGSGGAVAPAAPAPAASPTGAPVEDWASLGSVDDLDHIEIPAAPPAATPQTATPPVPPAAAPPAPPAQPQVAQPPAPQTGQPPGQGAERPLTASDPWRIAEGLEANRDAIVAHLAQAKFALSEDDIKELDTDVTVAVPKLLARVFLESQVSMQKFLAQAVPGMVKQYNTVTSANNDAETKFFDAHKALDRTNPQHRQTAIRIASLYRQANPDIPLGQLIQEVGPMVMAALRVNAPPGGTPGTALPGGRSPPPFRPAVNGGGGAPIAAEPANEWAGLGQEFD